MGFQKRHLLFSLLVFMGLVSDNYSMEYEEKNIVKIPSHIVIAYNKLDVRDKKQINEVYRERSATKTLKFISRSGLNADYNKTLIECFPPESKFIKEIILTRMMGRVTFESFFPILPQYNCLKTLDISTNCISDDMIKKYIAKFNLLTNLRKLLMGSNKICNDGFLLILNLFNSENMNLSYLGIEKNHISEKNSMNQLLKMENIKIKHLDLYNQQKKGDDDYLDDTDYETFIDKLSIKFPHFRCILRERDKHVLTRPGLPLDRLIVVSLTDTSTPNPKAEHNEKKALKLPISPMQKSVSKDTWSTRSSHCIMAIDPSGDGSDATGYAVIKVNEQGEYLITKAEGIKGNGLEDRTFKKLLKVVQTEDVETVIIESNYHEGAYLTAFKYYCQLQNVLKISKEGRKLENYPEEINLNFTLKSHKTTEKDKGQRIVSTLEPLLLSGKLFIEENFFYNDWEHREKNSSLYLEMSWIKKDFKSQAKEDGCHDDLVDALEMAISFSKNMLSKQTDVAQSGTAKFEQLLKSECTTASNKNRKEENTVFANQQFSITNNKISQVIKYIYEQTEKDSKKTGDYIGVYGSTILKLIENKTLSGPTWKSISSKLDTSEKVRDCLKESDFTSEQLQHIFEILNS